MDSDPHRRLRWCYHGLETAPRNLSATQHRLKPGRVDLQVRRGRLLFRSCTRLIVSIGSTSQMYHLRPNIFWPSPRRRLCRRYRHPHLHPQGPRWSIQRLPTMPPNPRPRTPPRSRTITRTISQACMSPADGMPTNVPRYYVRIHTSARLSRTVCFASSVTSGYSCGKIAPIARIPGCSIERSVLRSSKYLPCSDG